jgi:hypothetical protein
MIRHDQLWRGLRGSCLLLTRLVRFGKVEAVIDANGWLAGSGDGCWCWWLRHSMRGWPLPLLLLLMLLMGCAWSQWRVMDGLLAGMEVGRQFLLVALLGLHGLMTMITVLLGAVEIAVVLMLIVANLVSHGSGLMVGRCMCGRRLPGIPKPLDARLSQARLLWRLLLRVLLWRLLLLLRRWQPRLRRMVVLLLLLLRRRKCSSVWLPAPLMLCLMLRLRWT